MNHDFDNKKIAFIGAGNMSRSIIGGMVGNEFPPANVIAANPSLGKLDALNKDFEISTTQDNLQAVKDADMVVLSVKPQMMATVCQQLSELGEQLNDKLFVSLAAGVTCDRIKALLGRDVPMIRCMPNTPALYGKGVSGLFASGASQTQQAFAEYVMKATGLVVWVDKEQKIDAITAISGSGPAYFFMFMEAMVDKAQQLGFDEQTARQLVQHTASGAATMVEHSDEPIAVLRQKVTSKGGTTAAALGVYSEQGLPAMVDDAMQAACDRAHEMATTL
ncbi:MAG: pyrroline-5-carboxylate reductase [Psychrosphaera sp.]|nr:pyrroline-5-carboxylate reductase [Psychrosphaera sp.]